MLRFQRIQSEFFFKLNILSSKRFQTVLVWILPALILLQREFFCRSFSVAFVQSRRKENSARFVADAFIVHICQIKDMSR